MMENDTYDVNNYIKKIKINLNTTSLSLPHYVNCLNGIEKLSHLCSLRLDGIIYFEHFYKLKNLKHLESLDISLHNVNSLNEVDIPLNLISLRIYSNSIRSIEGVEKFKNLCTLSLYYTNIPIDKELISQLNNTKIQRISFPYRVFDIQLLRGLNIPHIKIHPDMKKFLLNSKHLLEMQNTRSINSVLDISIRKKRIKYTSNINFLFKKQ